MLKTASEKPFYWQYPQRPCPVCGSIQNWLLFRQTFSEMSSGSLLQGYDVVICGGCGFGFANHIPDQAVFDAYYRDMSKYEYQDQGGKETEYDLARFKAMVDTIRPFLSNQSAHIFDVGCSTGRLLSLFKENGYPHVTGLDPSPVCAQAAQSLYGIRVLTGAVSDIAKVMDAEPHFDCVILSGVLEHIRDVEHALQSMRNLLVDGGLIFVEVPDATDFASWPDAPFQEFSTEHINFFSTTSLANLMRRYGFTPVVCQRVPRHQSQSTVIPVRSAIYRKEENLNMAMPVFDTETECGLWAYIHKSQQVDEAIRQVIDALVDNAKPIIVWGVGTHTLRLLATSRLAQANIRAFVDSNPRYQGKQLNGLSIIAPVDLQHRTEAILISSRVFQSDIEGQIRDDLRLRNEIIKLYTLA